MNNNTEQTKKEALLVSISTGLHMLLTNIIDCQYNYPNPLEQQQKAFKLNTAIKEAKDYIDKLGL